MTKGRRTVDPVTGLTANMEAFCVELVRTDDASGSYKKAYCCERMKAATISRAAFELQQNPKIITRLQSLRSEARKKSGITMGEHMTALLALRNGAAQRNQFGPAVSAEMARGKVSGLYDNDAEIEDLKPITRVEIVIKDGRKPKEGGDA
jgi:phage terminase small subunit